MVLCIPKHYNTIFRGAAHNSHKNYLGVRWRWMFNKYLSVLTNLIIFVYLDVFLQFNFVLMNIRHFFELLLCLILITLMRHLKGHMKILALALYHKSNYLESHCQHRISNDIDLQNCHFYSYHIFFGKIKHLYRMHRNILCFV